MTHLHPRPFPPLRRWLPGAAAALVLGASLACHAGGGEALDIERPSMRTPVGSVPGDLRRSLLADLG